jgi:hypothetical protein
MTDALQLSAPVFDLDIERDDKWPMPLPAPEQKSLWARIWDAIREPFNFGGEL